MRATPWLLCIGAAAVWATAGLAQCRVAQMESCAIDLHGEGAPRVTESCDHEAWKKHVAFQLPERFADDDGDGWHEVVLEIDLDPALGCGCAVFRIAFEGEPTGRILNIGDSPTNDGYGGDADSTRFDAELMLVEDGRIAIFGSDRHGAPVGSQQVLGLSALDLTDGLLELEVCDQYVRFAVEPAAGGEGLSGFLRAADSGDLFAIRQPSGEPPDAAGEIGADSRIYASFNRVIHRRSGRPVRSRFGTGVRRVEMTLTP